MLFSILSFLRLLLWVNVLSNLEWNEPCWWYKCMLLIGKLFKRCSTVLYLSCSSYRPKVVTPNNQIQVNELQWNINKWNMLAGTSPLKFHFSDENETCVAFKVRIIFSFDFRSFSSWISEVRFCKGTKPEPYSTSF